MKPDARIRYDLPESILETQVFGTAEIYSSSFETFAVDGSGGEYGKADGSIGYISRASGRVAEAGGYLSFQCAGCISDLL